MEIGLQSSAMLLGRRGECRRIDALLSTARSGRGATLVVRGEPGIGKSALLDYAVRRASQAIVLRARGTESDAEYAFAGLHDFLRPIDSLVEELPSSQERALRAALRLEASPGDDRFMVAAATLGILSAAAEVTPVLIAIDDAHWIDSASMDALVFALRRLEHDAVAALLAVRDGEPTRLDLGRFDELRVVGLDVTSSAALAARSGRQLSGHDLEALLALSRGNPLAIIELSHHGLPARTDGGLNEPFTVSESVQRSYVRRIHDLPLSAKTVLLIAAADDRNDLATVVSAARALGYDDLALDIAEQSGLVEVVGNRLEFRHPLARSALYQAAAASERRRVHRALADVQLGDDVQARRAWHLAAAAVGPEEPVAYELERAAVGTASRGGHLAASAALERASRLTPDEEARARRLVAAGEQAWYGGSASEAERLFSSAFAATRDPVRRTEVQRWRARISRFAGRPLEAESILAEEVSLASPNDPGTAALLADAVGLLLFAGQLSDGLSAARRAWQLAPDSHDLGSSLGIALMLSGDHDQAVVHLRRAVASASGGTATVWTRINVTYVLCWLCEYRRACELALAGLAETRRQSAPGLVVPWLEAVGNHEFNTGDWTNADAAHSEVLHLAADTAPCECRECALDERCDRRRSWTGRGLSRAAGATREPRRRDRLLWRPGQAVRAGPSCAVARKPRSRHRRAGAHCGSGPRAGHRFPPATNLRPRRGVFPPRSRGGGCGRSGADALSRSPVVGACRVRTLPRARGG